MIWLLISILTNSGLLLILKSFTKFKVNTFQAIVVNHLTAGTIGLLLSGMPIPANCILSQKWIWVAPLLGALFISIFVLIAKTAQTIGVSVATVANKMSLVIPVLVAIVFYHESATALKIIGLVIAILSVYFTSLPPEKKTANQKIDFKYFLFPALIFIGSGVIDAIVNHAQLKLVPAAHLPIFISFCFFSAALIGISIIIFRAIKFKEKFESKSLVAGVLLGIPNYFSIYGITKALGSNIMESSALYPVNNMGIVAVSAIGALLIFKEKFSNVNWLGILLSLGSIALIAFGNKIYAFF